MEWPATDTISLGDLRAANKVLVGSGAPIGEINAVRRSPQSKAADWPRAPRL
jgi:glycerate-2-kinase